MEPSDNDVLLRLRNALESRSLPGDAANLGNRLLNRLEAPVTVAVLGPKASGKSQLVNFVSGHEIIPSGANCPVLTLCWGPEEKTYTTKHDGTLETRIGIELSEIHTESHSQIRIEANLDNLKQIQIFKAPFDHSKPLQTTIERADIVLWCSQEFCVAERQLWATVPDALKDHSFLVLTKADSLAAAGTLAGRIEELQDIVSEEFHSLIPLATRQAIASKDENGNVDDNLLSASGGKALLHALNAEVASGRMADVDSAQLFLKRYQVDKKQLSTKAAVIAEPREASLAELSQSALDYLNGQVQRLVQVDMLEQEDNASDILDICAEAANGLADIFIDQISTDEVILALQGDLMEAADIMLLLQMEDGAEPAANATTVLLQIQRDLKVKIAA